MSDSTKSRLSHNHTFEVAGARRNERRTHVVVAMTATMMVVEIVAGIAFGSMALLADGIHMASHAVALGISAFAYAYARRHAADPRFSFGTGKVNSLGGYTGALLLGLFALLMAWESIERLFNPVEIAFSQALVVAVAGLVINGISVFVLGAREHHHDHDDHHHDHNIRAAYLHVLADAVTSLTAIVALVVGKIFGILWVDPLMGIAGAVLVGRWSFGLLKQTSMVLLDRQASRPAGIVEKIVAEAEGVEISDLHVWSIAPGSYGVILGLSAPNEGVVETIRSKLSEHQELAHVSLDVRPMERT